MSPGPLQWRLLDRLRRASRRVVRASSAGTVVASGKAGTKVGVSGMVAGTSGSRRVGLTTVVDRGAAAPPAPRTAPMAAADHTTAGVL